MLLRYLDQLLDNVEILFGHPLLVAFGPDAFRQGLISPVFACQKSAGERTVRQNTDSIPQTDRGKFPFEVRADRGARGAVPSSGFGVPGYLGGA